MKEKKTRHYQLTKKAKQNINKVKRFVNCQFIEFTPAVNDMIGQLTHVFIGCEDLNSYQFVVGSFEPSILSSLFVYINDKFQWCSSKLVIRSSFLQIKFLEVD